MTFYDLSNGGSTGHFWFILKFINETTANAPNTLIMRESGGNIVTAGATDLLIGTSGASNPHNFTVTMYPNNTIDLVSDGVFVGTADTTVNGTFPIFWTDTAGGITVVKGFAVEQFQITPPIIQIDLTLVQPLDNAVLTATDVIFNYTPNVSGTTNFLIIDNQINQSHTSVLGTNAFPSIIGINDIYSCHF